MSWLAASATVNPVAACGKCAIDSLVSLSFKVVFELSSLRRLVTNLPVKLMFSAARPVRMRQAFSPNTTSITLCMLSIPRGWHGISKLTVFGDAATDLVAKLTRSLVALNR